MSSAAGGCLLPRGLALAAAGMLALSPAVSPPVPSPGLPEPPLPTVHVDDIGLTGIGQDIYEAITPGVQYVVGGVSYLINFIPLIGGPIAAQININYFQGIQPVVEATVNYLAAVVQDPLNVIASTGAYGRTLYGIGYDWVSAELMFLGLQPLPPLLQGAVGGEARSPRAVAGVPAAQTVSADPARGGVTTSAALGEAPVAIAEAAEEGATGPSVATEPSVVTATPEAPAESVSAGLTGPRERARAPRSAARTAPQLRTPVPSAFAETNPAGDAASADRSRLDRRPSVRVSRGA